MAQFIGIAIVPDDATKQAVIDIQGRLSDLGHGQLQPPLSLTEIYRIPQFFRVRSRMDCHWMLWPTS